MVVSSSVSEMDVTFILSEIGRAYPALSEKLSSLPEHERSDSRTMTDLGTHVVDLFEEGHIEAVRPAFELVERLISGDTESERQAAIVGFLETVQNVASHRTCGASVFEQFLGGESVGAWKELNATWSGKTSLAEIVASETGASLQPKWWQFWRRRNRRTPQELLGEVQNPELRKIIEQITRQGPSEGHGG